MPCTIFAGATPETSWTRDLHKVQADAAAAACILGDSDGDSDDDGQGHRPVV